jgi:hypothetical protein
MTKMFRLIYIAYGCGAVLHDYMQRKIIRSFKRKRIIRKHIVLLVREAKHLKYAVWAGGGRESPLPSPPG